MFTRIYALAVCFATILCITISAGIALFDIAQIALPKLTMNSYEYQNLQSNENFRSSGMVGSPKHFMMINPRAANATAIAQGMPNHSLEQDPISEDEVTRLREKQLAMVVDKTRHDATRSLIQIFIILFVSSPLFYIHWRLAQKLEA